MKFDLLHCNNARLAEARRVAWEGRSLRVLLVSPRWESRPLGFLEPSGVGRVVENEEDEEECRLDSWILWEAHPEMSVQRTAAVEEFPLYFLSVSLCESTLHIYPLGMKDTKRDSNK
jgi:hypothetical protein